METALCFHSLVFVTLLLKSPGERKTLIRNAMRQPLGMAMGVVCILRTLDHNYSFSKDRSI